MARHTWTTTREDDVDEDTTTLKDIDSRLRSVEHRLVSLEKSEKMSKASRIRQGKAIKEIQQNVLFVRWLATLIAVGFALFQSLDWLKGHIK